MLSTLPQGETSFGLQVLGAVSAVTYHLKLEDGSGSVLLENGSYLLLETAP